MEREMLRYTTIPNMNNVSNFSLNTQVVYSSVAYNEYRQL